MGTIVFRQASFPDSRMPEFDSSSSVVKTAALARPGALSPEELKELAKAQSAKAMQIETGPERLRLLTFADALMNLAEIKKLLLKYEKRLLN